MLNAELSIQLNTHVSSEDAVRTALVQCASDLIVKYGLGGDVRVAITAEPRLPDPETADALGPALARRVAVSELPIRDLIVEAARENTLIEIDYRDLGGNRTTRRIEPLKVYDDSRVTAYDHMRRDQRTFLLKGISRAEVV